MKQASSIRILAMLLVGAGALCFGQTVPSRIASPEPSRTVIAPLTAVPPMDAALHDLTDFMDRASKLKENDIEGRLWLARWARDRKMWSQAQEMADQVLYRDSGNRAAYLILQQVDDARPLAEEPEEEGILKEEFAKRFSHDFKTRNSKHFLICYDTADAFAAQRGAVMEKVYDAFQFYFNMGTLRPDFLEKRLPVLLLKDREDYLAYGKATEHADLSWASGFYSQRSNRSTFFDDSSGPSAASFTKQIADMKEKLDGLNQQIAAAGGQNQMGLVNTLTVERNRTGQAMAQLNNRLGAALQMSNNVKTMHEAAHQIAFNMGIQVRMVDYPMWFTEGLACSFEVEDSAGHRGPALVNFGRLEPVKIALKEKKLIPVERFISAAAPERNDEAGLSIVYSEGWALFHYLYKFHREGMEKYLLAYKMHAPLRIVGADERKVLFIRAFGDDLDDLDNKFQYYVKALPERAN